MVREAIGLQNDDEDIAAMAAQGVCEQEYAICHCEPSFIVLQDLAI